MFGDRPPGRWDVYFDVWNRMCTRYVRAADPATRGCFLLWERVSSQVPMFKVRPGFFEMSLRHGCRSWSGLGPVFGCRRSCCGQNLGRCARPCEKFSTFLQNLLRHEPAVIQHRECRKCVAPAARNDDKLRLRLLPLFRGVGNAVPPASAQDANIAGPSLAFLPFYE